jgi:hypothetical protein
MARARQEHDKGMPRGTARALQEHRKGMTRACSCHGIADTILSSCPCHVFDILFLTCMLLQCS